MIKKFYKNFRNILPNEAKGTLSKMAFTFSNKPFAKKDDIVREKKFPGSASGGFIVSADFELGWAFRYSKLNPKPIEMAELERRNFPYIIKILEDYNVPITWATVGHLMLQQCKKGDHDWMKRIPYMDDHWRFMNGDWFDCDPYTSWEKGKHWYAPDLIEQILNSKIKHEIGCHTFSHIDCTYRNCPPEVIDDELKACIEAAKPWGIELKSLVFPGGTAGNYEILKKHGFQIYRKNISIDIAYPYFDEHELLLSPTSASFGDNGFGWSADYYIYRFKKFIDKAIETGTVCHVWFHPSVDIWTLDNVLPGVIKYAAEKREEGKLWIPTMGEIANHINKNLKDQDTY
ncbi:MAG TPA: polysaccharide deacetylase family protein [Ignavibacteriaceae bacterium]|nr:polysaccharide deacetylase family protein [Ignavibacteriaceae bacterium]